MDVTRASLKRPKGWYALASAREIKSGEVLPKKLMDKDLVLFRTQSGKVCGLDAYCTHLGAHLGYGGTVCGEMIRCPFHGYCYNSQGHNISKTCPTDPIFAWPILERNGYIFVYYGGESREKPTWSIPTCDLQNFKEYHSNKFTVSSHPQEIFENVFDNRHIKVMHKYNDLDIIDDFQTQGVSSRVSFNIKEPLNVLGRTYTVDVRISAENWGLGYQSVLTHMVDFNIYTHVFLLVTPRVHNEVDLHVLYYGNEQVEPGKGIFKMLPAYMVKFINRIILKKMQSHLIKAVEDDVNIWAHKSYVPKPCLANDEKRLVDYRNWAQQFYE